MHLAFVIPHPGEDTRLRIDNRVLQGGHNISDKDLKRRFPRILEHLPEAMKRADIVALYVSAEKSSDFVMVGAMHQGQLTVTPQLPAQSELFLKASFRRCRLPKVWAVPTPSHGNLARASSAIQKPDPRHEITFSRIRVFFF